MDGSLFLRLSSTFSAVFMDGRADIELVIHVFGGFRGRELVFELVIHVFDGFHGWEG